MKVYQAVYGEDESHGHGLLGHSPASQFDRVPFLDATHRTDLPGNPPSGTIWTPYLRSFVEGDYYVLSRTSPDENARRRGMVRTHALFLPALQFCDEGNLSQAIEFLRTVSGSPEAKHDLHTTELPADATLYATPEFPWEQHQAFVRMIVEGNGKLPVVWIGQDHFDEAISRIWTYLTPELRRVFTFRISFSPRDVEDLPPSAVCTPESVASHWPPPYQAVYRSSTTAQITPSVDYLLGGEKGDALRALQRKLDLVVDDLGHIRDLANIYANLEETRRGGGIEPLDASVRLIGKAVPDPVRGSTLKESLLAELRSLTADAGIPELRALRNFPVDSFTQGSTFIDSTVEAWFRSKVANPRQCTATDVAKVIGEGFQAETLWAKAVRAAVTKLLTSMDSSSASALWRWWSSSPPLIELLAPRVPMTRVAERALVDTCPVSLDRDGGEHVRKFTSTRKWVSLHACVVKAYLPWEDAIAEQLQVDVDEANTADLAWMCHSVSSSAVLDVAIASGDARLLKIAAERIESDISLKTTLDVGNPRWRTIWLLSIRAGVAPFAGIDDAASVRDALLDEVIAGEDVEELLHDLALDGELADLSGYSQREHLWPQLSPTIRQVLLLATAEGWLRRFSTPPHQADDPEPELRRMLLGSSRVRARLLEASSNVGLTLAFLRRFPDYANREALLADWIKRHPNVGRFDAATVGAFIQEHRWRSAARLVAQQADAGRGEWDYGADACVDMLGIVHRVFRRVKRGKKISLDDWWDAWIEMSSQLYPFGIRDRNIWERSAGDPSLIEVDRDGRSQWHQALRIIRHGADGVTIEGLLHQMRQDWPNNEKLETLERLWKRNELH